MPCFRLPTFALAGGFFSLNQMFFFLHHSAYSPQNCLLALIELEVIMPFIRVLLCQIIEKITLTTQQLAVGEGEKTCISSSTLKVSQYGTPEAFASDFRMSLVSVFSKIFWYFVVGEALTKGLSLTYISTFVVHPFKTGWPSYSSGGFGTTHSVELIFYSPLSCKNYVNDIGLECSHIFLK